MGMLKAGKDMTKTVSCSSDFTTHCRIGLFTWIYCCFIGKAVPRPWEEAVPQTHPAFNWNFAVPDLIRITFKSLHCLRDAFLSVVFMKITPNLCAHVEFKSNDGCAVATTLLSSLSASASGGSWNRGESWRIKTSLLATPGCAPNWHSESSELSGFLQNYFLMSSAANKIHRAWEIVQLQYF